MTCLPVQYSQEAAPPPLHALPKLFHRIAYEFAPSRVDAAIVCSALLAFISLLTQGLYDVQWPNRQRRRIGVSGLLVAPSGSGKSLVYRALLDPISKCLAAFTSGGDGRRSPEFFVEDVTREALIRHLMEWPIAALFTDEAGQTKTLLRHGLSTMAKCMDGDPLYHARVSEGRVHLKGQLLLMYMMLQPEVFKSMKASLGSGNGGVGIGNRMLWAQGHALPHYARLDLVRMSDEVLQQYTALVESLIFRTVERVSSKQERPALRLSSAATRHLLGLGDSMQHFQSCTGRWRQAGEYASRHPERTLSLAAAFHALEQDDSDEVPLALVEAADEFGRWSIDSYARMTFEPPRFTATEQDALTLEAALHQVVLATCSTSLPLADLRRCASNIGLTRGRFDRAVACLGAQGKLLVVPNGRMDLLQMLVPVQPPIPHVYQ